jgi:hypothetical protein
MYFGQVYGNTCCSVGTWFLTCTVLFVCLILTVNVPIA